MKVVGVTGGIGSGKTTVCHVFSQLGIPVYNADSAAKSLMHSNQNLVSDIKTLFGKDIYKNDLLDRITLANMVFTNPEKLAQLNALVHPAVALNFKEWSNAQSTNLVIKEAAILFETGGNKAMDATIMVYAPEEIRVARVIKRDSVSEHQVFSRIKNQWSDKRKMSLADYVINNYNGHLVVPQVLGLLNALLKIGK